VVRSLAQELPARGWSVTVLSGSRRDIEGAGDARTFYRGLDPHVVDFTDALAAPDPMQPGPGSPPMHPSYEDREGAPDRVFASLNDADYERQVQAWTHALEAAGGDAVDVLHLHHLTPLNEAAVRAAPGVPVVGHLHGTELIMLERIAEGPPPAWDHAERWAERMRGWAADCAQLVVASAGGADRAARVLGIERGRFGVVPSGLDPAAWRRRPVDRPAHWRRHLVERPRGWRPGHDAGSVRYREADLTAFEDGPVLLYVGRFTAVKRLPLLIEAYARAQERFERRAPLVLIGGHAGEWEGEHPFDTIARTGASDVFLAGWHDREELAEFFSAADAIVLPSAAEQFGQVLIEGMACELPALAVRALGAAEIVDSGRTGWLVEPEDEGGLADALVEIVNHGDERRRRGRRARDAVCARFTAGAAADQLIQVLVAASRAPRGITRRAPRAAPAPTTG